LLKAAINGGDMRCTIIRFCLLLVLCGTQALAQQQFDDARQLERKILSDNIPQEEQSFPPRIQDLLSAGILQALNNGATAGDVQKKLESVLADPKLVNEPGNVSVLAFGERGNSALVIAYGIPYCVMCNRTWLGTYERVSGSYSNTYSVNQVLDNHTIYLHLLPANGGQKRFVLYGTGLGSADNPLAVQAYELSAGSLREFWTLDGLNNGSIQFQDNEILLRYIVLGGAPRASRRARVDKYRVTAEGISLESRSERMED
jgi:hypothetical protein